MRTNRTIKFRIFSFCDKTWHFWSVTQDYPQGIYGGVSEPQQFTGVKDKHGFDIYEGDELKFPNGEILEVIWVCESRGHDWTGWNTGYTDTMHSCEVVGNIFEEREEDKRKAKNA